MSELDPSVPTEDEQSVPSELDALKAQAKILGLSFHPAIGLETLKERVRGAMQDDEDVAQGKSIETGKKAIAGGMSKDEFDKMTRISNRRKALSLKRIRVQCLNPNKKEWEGELFSTGSAKLGTIKKYVPFNLDEGYHVPNIIYEMMKERKCTIFKTTRDSRGNKSRVGSLVNEFAIEVLEPLTKAELDDLAKQQALAGTID